VTGFIVWQKKCCAKPHGTVATASFLRQRKHHKKIKQMSQKYKRNCLAIMSALFIGVGMAFTIFACTKDASFMNNLISNKSNENKGLMISGYTFEKPDNGFLAVSENDRIGTTAVLLGTTPDEFIRMTLCVGSHIVDENDILYTFEDDLDALFFSNQNENGFDMTIWEETVHLCNFNDIEGGITFDINTPCGNLIKQTILHDSLDVASLLIDVSNLDIVENPFFAEEKYTKDVWPFLKKVLKIGGRVVAAAAVIAIAVDLIETECQRSLDTDKHNCEHSDKKCLKRRGLCHYDCIPCSN